MGNIDLSGVKFPMGRENPEDTFVDCYMDLVDWECELGMASGGNRVYPSLEDLKEHNRCHEGCGIVKVRVSFLEIVQPPKEEDLA
jgi:hypothetical protein